MPTKMADVTDHIVVSKSGRSKSIGKMHVPADDGLPLCKARTRTEVDWRIKPLSVYPPVWRNWCDDCKRLSL